MAVIVQHCSRLSRAFWPVLVLCAFCSGPFAQAQPPTTHFVDVGLNSFAQFTDRDTGKSTLTTNPVPTVIRVGDTVQWVFHYQHSSTAGSCPNGFCQPNGIWDSGILNGPPQTFQRAFTSTGIFPYFCQIHLSAMQGRVIVLNGPDFFLDVANNSQFFPPPPIPTVTVAAGQAATFTGNVSGFLGFTSPVHLSCGGTANPRLPANCPGTNVTPDGIGNAVPFSFTVVESVPGDYEFDIVAVGANTGHTTHSQRVKLSVINLSVANPTPNTISLPPSSFSAQVTVQVDTNLAAVVTLGCNGMPNGTFCGFTGFSFPPTPQNLMTTMGNFGGAPGVFSADITASAFFNGVSLIASTPINLIVIGPATHLESSALAATATKGVSLPFQLTARDLLNRAVTNYTGTAHFSSTDQAAVLPADTAFNLGNNGVRNFSVTFNTLGPRLVTAVDLLAPQIGWQSPIILVQPSAPANSTVALLSDRGPGNEPFFRDEAVNLEIRVSAASTPTGKVHLFDSTAEITPAAGLTLVALNGTTARAIVPTLRMRPGGHPLTVVYDGAGSFTANVIGGFSQPRSPAPRCVNNRCPGTH